MKPDELIVARLGKGATIVRYIGEKDSQVSVALGRNRQARIPHERVLLATGIVPSNQDEVTDFQARAQSLSATIDLAEVWEVVGEESGPLSLDHLAELYWGGSPPAIERAALVFHLDSGSDYLEYAGQGYVARSRQAVKEIQRRRRREAENAEAAASIMDSLSRGALPERLTPAQSTVLNHLRSYAILGDDFTRSREVRGLVESARGPSKDPQRRAFEMLVAAGVLSPDEPLELHRAGIRHRFPDEALAEASGVEVAALLRGQKRRDLTGLPVITIDDAGTEDRDDAISVELPSSAPEADFRIAIHIADAAALIEPDGPMDREAGQRMATLYLPEGNIGMVPPELVRRAGSLDPQETRLAVSLLVDVTASGDVSGWEVSPSLIRSRAALTYQEADGSLTDEGSPWHDVLKSLNVVAHASRRRRLRAGAMDLERSEMAVKVKSTGQVEVKVLDRSSPARGLVAELMILCNSLLADFAHKERLPAVYRSQASVDVADVAPAGPSGAEATFRRYLLTRRLRPAELDTVPAPHGGLGLEAYIQITSPLRRYPDLVMQRQISHFLATGQPYYAIEQVATIVQRAEMELRELARLEEERKRYWFLKYLQQTRLEGRLPTSFLAAVLDVQPGRSALTELLEFPFRVRSTLPQSCSPGDTVTLELEGVDLWRRVPQFVHVPG